MIIDYESYSAENLKVAGKIDSVNRALKAVKVDGVIFVDDPRLVIHVEEDDKDILVWIENDGTSETIHIRAKDFSLADKTLKLKYKKPVEKFRKIPLEVEAIQYTGDNLRDVLNFTGKHKNFGYWFSTFENYQAHVKNEDMAFKVFTPHGAVKAYPGQWIIKDVDGNFYPCTDSVFWKTYEWIL